jgi:hypothetical protein
VGRASRQLRDQNEIVCPQGHTIERACSGLQFSRYGRVIGPLDAPVVRWPGAVLLGGCMSIDARNRPLPDWFTRLRTRQTVLPRFQRYEAWDRSTVTQMFNTILQDLPVVAVLVLEVGNEQPFVCRPLEGAPAEGERATEHLLDGQPSI